ncbi:hypothetical protein [Ignatzschineria sp. LJL83]
MKIWKQCGLVLMVLLGFISLSMANPVTYYMKFKANGMRCLLTINDVYIYSPVQHSPKIPRLVSLGHGVTEYLQQGENTVSVILSNNAEYIPKSEIENGYCEVEIIAMAANELGEVESKVVSHMRHTYVPRPEGSDSIFPYHLSTSESNTELDPLISPNGIESIERPHNYDANNEPVQSIRSNQTLIVHHETPMSWSQRATPFEDTEANKRKLWNKYQEIKQIIQTQDKRALRQLAEPGATDMARIFGRDVEAHFETTFKEVIQDFFEIDTEYYRDEYIPYEDYELEIYAEGKLFRLNRKGFLISSPLRWYNPFNQESLIYNPLFTFIDGEIVMATF